MDSSLLCSFGKDYVKWSSRPHSLYYIAPFINSNMIRKQKMHITYLFSKVLTLINFNQSYGKLTPWGKFALKSNCAKYIEMNCFLWKTWNAQHYSITRSILENNQWITSRVTSDMFCDCMKHLPAASEAYWVSVMVTSGVCGVSGVLGVTGVVGVTGAAGDVGVVGVAWPSRYLR